MAKQNLKKKKINSIHLYLSRFGIEEEKDYFLENVSMLISSGIGIPCSSFRRKRRKLGVLVFSPDMIAEEVDNGATLEGIGKKLEFQKSTLHRTLGEEGGQLAENLNVIIMRQRKSRSFKSKIQSAMMYPTIVLLLAFVIGTGIAW
jgi:type II secretory pathway component PulF